MVGISLCMIVKNEEDVLARCLESVRGIADEIIVVDTGSTDKTVEIARQFTNQVYYFDWRDDFSAARNFAFSFARNDYTLWLDADDLLLPADREAFLNLKDNLSPDVDVVLMKYNISFDTQGNPTFGYYRERLVRTGKFHWEGRVHEIIPPAGNLLFSNIAVTHRKTRPSAPDRNLKIYETMLSQGIALSPREQYYYARELFDHKRYQQAASCFSSFLKEGKGWVEDNISACLCMADCYFAAGERDRGLTALLHSFSYDLPRPEVCCALGQYFMQCDAYRQAAFWYETACRCKLPEHPLGFRNPDCADFIPYMQLCVCYDRLGEREQAYAYHQKAKKLKPDDPAVQYNEAYFTGQASCSEKES